MRLDEQGLTEADHEIRDRICEALNVKGLERRTITWSLMTWHKDWRKVLRISQKQFNLMRRLQEADDHGYCVCCCTGRRIHYKALDAGHFISRSKARTRFDPMNVHPQSKASNAHQFGSQSDEQYGEFMRDNFTEEQMADLYERSRDKEFTWRDHKEELISNRVKWASEIKKHEKRLSN